MSEAIYNLSSSFAGNGDGMNVLYGFFDKQIESWPLAKKNFIDLSSASVRTLSNDGLVLKVQFNPARIVSTAAKVDEKSIEKRPCFLCRNNKPEEQTALIFDGKMDICVNPYPILPMHFTVSSDVHEPQNVKKCYGEIFRLLSSFPDLTVVYNGPRSGASAPDHLHLQAGTSGLLPVQTQWGVIKKTEETLFRIDDVNRITLSTSFVVPVFAVYCKDEVSSKMLFSRLYNSLPQPFAGEEPMMNIVAWRVDDEVISVVIPRSKHRPDCYFADGEEKVMVSPGVIDMSGLLITPRKEDFDKLTFSRVAAILRECGISVDAARLIADKIKHTNKMKNDNQPVVTVGIVSGKEISITFNQPFNCNGKESVKGSFKAEISDGNILLDGRTYAELVFNPIADDASFSLDDVTIGVNFHWERKERQTFLGSLKLIINEDKICAINILPVERYLESVISSEMSATSSLELLKAHAVISRSWLLAQIENRCRNIKNTDTVSSHLSPDGSELIRWYDRDDHTLFDVCADDHCQRYQGITKETSPNVKTAVAATSGEVLYSDGNICDARFSKSCGGVTEEFQFCWDDTPKTYLQAAGDNAEEAMPDLTDEANAEKWIRSAPPSFCNTTDKTILSQVLNDYDTETVDFYRWRVSYSQDELSQLIKEKTDIDFGSIIDMIPLLRGKSGRISKLVVVGTKRRMIIGKELEIRRMLSRSHLYSSAFVVDKHYADDDENLSSTPIPVSFDIIGAGWGHGVGLCQIGAAVMGAKGYGYKEILKHYFHGAELKKSY